MKTQYPFYEVPDEFEIVRDVIDVVLRTYQDNPVFRYKCDKEIEEKYKEEFVTDIKFVGQMFHA